MKRWFDSLTRNTVESTSKQLGSGRSESAIDGTDNYPFAHVKNADEIHARQMVVR
jgi:hypothetical protein